MQCHVCNSSEFDLFDGVYFCRECNSQIEASRKEESQQEGGFSKKSKLKSGKEKKANVLAKQKFYNDWTTTDGYNAIICKQVAALINLGASEKLKNVVLYIWSKYLEKCELAFRTDNNSKENVSRLNVCAKRRDIKVLYRDQIASWKMKKTKRKSSKGKKQIEKEGTDFSDEMRSDGHETSDNPTMGPATESEGVTESDGESDSSNSKKIKVLKYSSLARKVRKVYRKRKLKKTPMFAKRCVHNMTICKTLSFCYLGLLYTEDQLSLCDLLRLVKEGKVPYIDVTHVFPPSMQLQYFDKNCFTTLCVPSQRQISTMCAKLFKFLKLPSFKHPSLMPAVFRFVKDLNLPEGLIPIANHLYSKMKRKNDIWYKTKCHYEYITLQLPKYDVEAMALILVSLKLLLVLDGKFEVEHSKIMRKINVLIEGPRMFVWDDWKKQMKLKEFIFVKNGCTYSDFSRLDTLSVDEITRKYPITRLREYGDYTNRAKNNEKSRFSLARKEVKTLIENITDQEDAFAFNKPTSFPLKSELSRYVAEGGTWHMFKETKNWDMAILNKDFSSDFLFYRRTQEISEKSEELIFLLLSTLYESSEILALSHWSSSYQNMLKTSSQYWYKNIPYLEFMEQRQLWCKKLPASFLWLLKLLCKYLQVSCDDLYLAVYSIEKELFL